MDWYAWAAAFALSVLFISIACVLIFEPVEEVSVEKEIIDACDDACFVPSFGQNLDKDCFFDCLKMMQEKHAEAVK